MHGPAVTTGAPLLYEEKTGRSLGPPRAFQSSSCAPPTFTLTSPLCGPIQESQGQDEPLGELGPCTPFAEQPGTGARKDGRCQSLNGSRAAVSAPADGHMKQNSLQSCESASSTEVRLLSLAPGPQTVTTAQNIQGVTGSSAGVSGATPGADIHFTQKLYGIRSSAGRNFKPSDQQAPAGAAVTTGHTGFADARQPAGGKAERRDGLRRHAKRKTADACEPAVAGWAHERATSATCVTLDQASNRRRISIADATGLRAKERREAEVREANDKIALLEAERTEQRQRCAAIEGECDRLRSRLAELRDRCGAASAQNRRLQTELRYLSAQLCARMNSANAGQAAVGAPLETTQTAYARQPYLPGCAPGSSAYYDGLEDFILGGFDSLAG